MELLLNILLLDFSLGACKAEPADLVQSQGICALAHSEQQCWLPAI